MEIIKQWKFTIFCSLLAITLLTYQLIFNTFKNDAQIIATPNNDPYVEAIELSAQWFVNNQDENFIHYQYFPYENKHSEKHHRLRESGALWSIAKAANYFEDEELMNLSKKGFNYFENSFEYVEGDDFIYVDIIPDDIKLGYNAFSILTLLEIDHPNKNYLLEKLANGIIYQQESHGGLKTFFFSDRATGIDYYPGEALLALMSLYEYNGNEKYLETVEKAFPFYTEYWKANPNTAFTPWQSRAYYKFYKATGNEDVKKFIFEMNDFMLNSYKPKGKCSEFNITNSVIAVHAEGVNMAYDLAEREKKECYKNFSKEAADYILSIQLTNEAKYPKAAIGGILGSETSKNMRVDRNQHAILNLMDAYEFGILD